MRTVAPGALTRGEKSSMIGAGPVTMKLFVVIAVPAGVWTVIGPLVAPVGTVAWIWVGALTANAARLSLNSTLVAPTKLNPSISTAVFVPLRAGAKPVMRGATRNVALLAPVPLGLVTLTGPVVASEGTVAIIRVSDETAKSPGAAPNWTRVTVEKPEPLMTIWLPGLPWLGEKLRTTGTARSRGPRNKNRSTNARVPARKRLLTRIVLLTVKVI